MSSVLMPLYAQLISVLFLKYTVATTETTATVTTTTATIVIKNKQRYQ